MLNREGINSPDSQETNQRESMPFHKHTYVEPEVNEEVTKQIIGGISAELFEEKLEEINRDLRKFDTATEIQPISNSSTGKENFLESMTLNEIFKRASQACATPLGSNRVPLSAIPDTSNTYTKTSATWKRQCKLLPEDTLHALFLCPKLEGVWCSVQSQVTMSSDTKARVTVLETTVGVPAEGEQISLCDRLDTIFAETTAVWNDLAEQRELVLNRVEELAAVMDAQNQATRETQCQLETKIALLKRAVSGLPREGEVATKVKPWAQLELKRQAVRDLPSAMSAADALVDYKFSKPNGEEEKCKSKDKGRDKQKKDGKKKDKQKKTWGNKNKGENSTSQPSKEQPKLNAGYFICNGPYCARDCPKREKLNAMVAEDGSG
nr:hypothetical protein CFP56_69825 [Quercus suber]